MKREKVRLMPASGIMQQFALGRAHNVITSDELKGLSEIPSHEWVNRQIHKLVQVFFI